MGAQKTRIGVVAPASAMEPKLAAKVTALVGRLYPGGAVEIVFHPQCFESWGHFAGTDQRRAQAFLEIANDPGFHALWFGRGGYGSCRILERVVPALTPEARAKTYLGYSDMGSLLGALMGQGFPHLAHGPMPADIGRKGGEAALARALAFLVERDTAALEPSVLAGAPCVAFNATILSHLLGTPFQPDLTGHVVMLEEVGEYMYRLDRDLFHITANPNLRRVAGLRLGRCSDIPRNHPDFGQSEEQVARHWCEQAGIAYLGRADIGHDGDNKVVPFGRWPWPLA